MPAEPFWLDMAEDFLDAPVPGRVFPGTSIEKDFAWSPAHPVVEAYRAYNRMPYDAPTLDMAAMLYAIRPESGLFQVASLETQIAENGPPAS